MYIIQNKIQCLLTLVQLTLRTYAKYLLVIPVNILLPS